MTPAITPNGQIDNSGAVQFDGLTLISAPAISSAIAAAIPPGSGAIPATTFAPIVIQPIFDTDIVNQTSSAADPTTAAEIENAISAAIDYIDTEFASSVPAIFNNGTIANTVTINIAFDHGTLAGQPLTSVSGASRSQSLAYLFGYPQIQSLVPNAPAADPTGGDYFYLPFAEMKALGFNGDTPITATSPEVDGYIALNTIANGATLDYNLADQTIPGEISALGAIEHEITEVFGRISIAGSESARGIPIYTLMDLSRYSAPGVLAQSPGAADYFSLNGGTTDLAAFNDVANGGDPGDWAASVPNDSFDAFLIPGSPDIVSGVDSRVLASIGFTPLIAPVTIGGATAGQSATDTSTPRPFRSLIVNDPNPGQTDTVTVTLSTIANGALSNLSGGVWNATSGVYTDSGTSSAITSALNALIFTPNAHQVAPGQSVSTTFTVADTDTAGMSASDGTTSVIATAAGIAPSIAGTTAGQTTTDQMPITLFPKVALTDVNAGQTETVTVTISAPANGTLTNPGLGTINAATGVWTASGPVAVVTTALDGLVFAPTSHQSAAGQTVTTTFTIDMTDTAGLVALDHATSLITAQTPANGSGLLAALNVSQQLELIYIAYFNRAADSAGFGFWGGQSLAVEASGQTAAAALTNVANAFTPQPETTALYPFLASQTLDLSTPAARAGLGAFIASVYANLFNRPADSSGEDYWVSQIASGAVGAGAAALAIANGAAGADAVELLNKTAVALNFTTTTKVAGLGATSPLPASFLTAAQNALKGVDGTSLNDASVTAAIAATAAWVAAPGGAVTGTAFPGAGLLDPDVITVTGQDQLVDPGAGNHVIRFLPGAAADTIVPHAGGTEQVSGWDPATDALDVSALLLAASIAPGTPPSGIPLANYLTVSDQGSDAVVQFDPTGQSGGATIAVLWGVGNVITGLDKLLTR